MLARKCREEERELVARARGPRKEKASSEFFFSSFLLPFLNVLFSIIAGPSLLRQRQQQNGKPQPLHLLRPSRRSRPRRHALPRPSLSLPLLPRCRLLVFLLRLLLLRRQRRGRPPGRSADSRQRSATPRPRAPRSRMIRPLLLLEVEASWTRCRWRSWSRRWRGLGARGPR